MFLGLSGPAAFAQWQRQAIAADADFRGLCVVSEKVAWVSGTQGTYARAADAGRTWSVGTVPGAARLDFRDVEAFGEPTAYLLSAGPGADSRVYKTADGGRTWALQFQGHDPDGFLDALAFWDDRHGVALGDPVKGRFQLLVTDDGGTRWRQLPGTNLPPALPSEGAFAASGTCLTTQGKSDVWFCTGGARAARVFHSAGRGRTWAVSATPLLAGTASAGAFSIAFRDRQHGMVVGGDYRKPQESGTTAAVTADGGRTWAPIYRPFAFRSCVAWAKDRWVAVGTSGSDVSLDGGATWKPLDRENYTAARPGSRWTARTITPSGSPGRGKAGPLGRTAALRSSPGSRPRPQAILPDQGTAGAEGLDGRLCQRYAARLTAGCLLRATRRPGASGARQRPSGLGRPAVRPDGLPAPFPGKSVVGRGIPTGRAVPSGTVLAGRAVSGVYTSSPKALAAARPRWPRAHWPHRRARKNERRLTSSKCWSPALTRTIPKRAAAGPSLATLIAGMTWPFCT